ncbi:MAG: hypothetical protein M0Z31_05075 [Clostridia bacterium]|nr:hypothetical protein [Clostridia bacterium]
MNQTKGKVLINNTQYWLLLTCMLWPTIIGYGGGIMARQASRNMLLSGILSLLVTILSPN